MGMEYHTGKKIEKAFLALVERRDMDKITVKDISENAGVARRTFYHYYRDIPHLMEEILRVHTEKMIARSMASELPIEILELFVEQMDQNRRLLGRVLESRFRAEAERYLLDAVKQILSAVFRKNYRALKLSADEEDFVVDVSACMIFTYLLEHFDRRDKESREICQRFLWLLEGIFKQTDGMEKS